MSTAKMILNLCDAVGVSGFEDRAAQTAWGMLAQLGPCETTQLGSLICRVHEAGKGAPHVMLTAHLDQIGMIVSYIEENGFLRVSNCGGIDRSLVLAAQVQVHTENGPLDGVICTIPPHLNPDDGKLPKLEDLCIDVGMTGEEAREKIALGDRVTICGQARELPGGLVCAPSIDDRAGCASVILAAKRLAAAKLGCTLSVALVSMEEVGSQGAYTAAVKLTPTHCVAVDVSFAHTPDAPRAKCGLMGKGAMVGIAPVLDNGMFKQMKKLAKEAGIPYQTEVMGGGTGTDADAVAISGAGVRCALLSIPIKYMHTPIEMVCVTDVEAVADLIVSYVRAEFGGDGNAL
ncbi:M42 family metallopeptidase [Anaerotruncus rubiinfantis]|uniref:M42 family metallopeptidase n=1 Tax=Anaerotruncus rubiinfantis TaxID=1720200 RepID=UPI0034A55282